MAAVEVCKVAVGVVVPPTAADLSVFLAVVEDAVALSVGCFPLDGNEDVVGVDLPALSLPFVHA